MNFFHDLLKSLLLLLVVSFSSQVNAQVVEGVAMELIWPNLNPYIDFSNSAGDDFDARFILVNDDLLQLDGTNLKLSTTPGIGNLFWGAGSLLTPDQGGSIELGAPGTAPYLDFRNDNGDFDARFILAPTNVLLFDGKMGFGTDQTGSHKLAVEGSIGCRRVKVEVGSWSDFVFDKDYTLPSLEEVEEHIQAYGHLKDVPSEKEVKANGMYLGEMDAKLLQKIEELTLYTIQQEKTIQQLMERMEEMEKNVKGKE